MSEKIPSTFHLKVVTPKRLLGEADADFLSLPTLEGSLGILPGHRPLYVAIGEGLLTYRAEGEEQSFRIKGGFAHVRQDQVIVMTEIDEHEQNRPPDQQG